MKISYLTWLYERTGIHSENINLPEETRTISDLIDYLESKDLRYRNLFKNRDVIYSALNGETVSHSTEIENSDELSFYSAIAGG